LVEWIDAIPASDDGDDMSFSFLLSSELISSSVIPKLEQE
jgi:hypothetical protein